MIEIVFFIFYFCLYYCYQNLIQLQKKKKHSKNNIIRAFDSTNSKMVIILLAKIVTFYEILIIRYVWGLNFQKLLLELIKKQNSSF